MKTAKQLLFYFSAFIILNAAHPQPLTEGLRNSLTGVVNFLKKEAQDVVDHLNGLHNNPVGDSSHEPMEAKPSKRILEKFEKSGSTSQRPGIHIKTHKNSEQSKSAKPVAPIQNNRNEEISAKLMALTKKDASPSPSPSLESNKPKIDYHRVLGIKNPGAMTQERSMKRIQSAFKKKALQTIPYYNPHDVNADEEFGKIVLAYRTLVDPEWKALKNPEGKKETLKDALDYADGVYTTLFGAFEKIIGSASFGVREVIVDELKRDRLNKGFLISQDSARWAHYPSSNSLHVQSTNPTMELGPESNLNNIPGKDTSGESPSELFFSAKVEHLSEELIKRMLDYVIDRNRKKEEMLAGKPSKKGALEMELEELTKENLGPEILQTVGHAYLSKAKIYSSETNLRSWIERTKEYYRLILEAVRLIRAGWSAILKARRSAAEIPLEKRLESKTRYAEASLKYIYMKAMLEATVTVHRACSRVLSEPGLSAKEAKERAVVLGMIGKAYLSIGKEPGKDTFKVSQLKIKESKRNAPMTSTKGKQKLT